MRIYLTSLGCKVNQAETDALARRLVEAGRQVAGDPHHADWAIVNTCTVTHIAARKSRQLIRRLHRTNARLRIAVTGCHVEMFAEETAGLEGVDLVVPNAQKDDLIERILESVSQEPQRSTPHPASSSIGRTRAFIKIQDGCGNHCTYCIVTLARGPSRSRALSAALADVQARVDEGYREIVLTGVNAGAYGRDLEGEPSLAYLVRAIASDQRLGRLRLSSVEPWDFTDDLLKCWSDKRLCRHIHLPLQSGCDQTLRRMNRHYSTERYAALVADIRRQVPDVAITTDVIVGFPGETDAEFEASATFVEAMAFSRLHVFRYSRRPGTPAAALRGQIPARVAQDRSQRMVALGGRMAEAFHEGSLGARVQVLFEEKSHRDGQPGWQGLTDTYLRVWAPSNRDLHNTFGLVCCMSVDRTGIVGELVGAS